MTTALTEWFKNPSEMFAAQSCPTCTPPTKKWFVSDPPGMAGNANAEGNPESKWRFCGTSLGGGAFDTDDVYKTYEQLKVRCVEFQGTLTMQDWGTATVRGYNSGNSLAAKAGE